MQDKARQKQIHSKVSQLFFLMLFFLWRTSFLTTFYGLYFNQQVHNNSLWASEGSGHVLPQLPVLFWLVVDTPLCCTPVCACILLSWFIIRIPRIWCQKICLLFYNKFWSQILTSIMPATEGRGIPYQTKKQHIIASTHTHQDQPNPTHETYTWISHHALVLIILTIMFIIKSALSVWNSDPAHFKGLLSTTQTKYPTYSFLLYLF